MRAPPVSLTQFTNVQLSNNIMYLCLYITYFLRLSRSYILWHKDLASQRSETYQSFLRESGGHSSSSSGTEGWGLVKRWSNPDRPHHGRRRIPWTTVCVWFLKCGTLAGVKLTLRMLQIPQCRVPRLNAANSCWWMFSI